MFQFPKHKPKQIELIFQKKKTDCGIACAAMLSFCTYEEALGVAKKLKINMKNGIFLDDFFEILECFDLFVRQIKTLPKRGCALVTINWKKKNLSGHFVVWDGKRQQFLDPTFGVINKEDMLESADIEEIWKIVF